MQGTPSRSSPSMQSLASSIGQRLGLRPSMAASPSRSERRQRLSHRRSIDPQPYGAPHHPPLRRAITEASRTLTEALREADLEAGDAARDEPPLPDWQGAWQQLQGENAGEMTREPLAKAEVPLSPYAAHSSQGAERKVAPSGASFGSGRPPRPSLTASPPASAPATPRVPKQARPGTSDAASAWREPVAGPARRSASPRRPAMQPRHSTGGAAILGGGGGAAAADSALPRRHSMAAERPPVASPPASLAARVSVVLGEPPSAPPQAPGAVPAPSSPSRRPPLLRQVVPLTASSLRSFPLIQNLQSPCPARTSVPCPSPSKRCEGRTSDPNLRVTGGARVLRRGRWERGWRARCRMRRAVSQRVSHWHRSQACSSERRSPSAAVPAGASARSRLSSRSATALIITAIPGRVAALASQELWRECGRVGLMTSQRSHAACWLQEMQAELSAEGSGPGTGSASGLPGGQGERRERATMAALLENTVVPELGALAARCNRLVSQASLAFSESPADMSKTWHQQSSACPP